MASYESSTVILEYPGASKPGLKLVAKRYVPRGAASKGLTLLFTHCTGSRTCPPSPPASSTCPH